MSEEKKPQWLSGMPDRLSAEEIARRSTAERKALPFGDFLDCTEDFEEALALDLECLGEAIENDDELIRDENARSGKEGPENGNSN